MSEFVKLKPASKQLGIAYYKLREWAVDGEIPAMRTGGTRGTWIVDVEQVRESLRKRMAA